MALMSRRSTRTDVNAGRSPTAKKMVGSLREVLWDGPSLGIKGCRSISTLRYLISHNVPHGILVMQLANARDASHSTFVYSRRSLQPAARLTCSQPQCLIWAR